MEKKPFFYTARESKQSVELSHLSNCHSTAKNLMTLSLLYAFVGLCLGCYAKAAHVIASDAGGSQNFTVKNNQPPSVLAWSDLKIGTSSSTIVRIPGGEVLSGRLLGILGPSGSGKSTFIRALGSRLSRNLRLTGSISYVVDGKNQPLNEDDVAYVHQDDNFFAMLSVRETLELSLALQVNAMNLLRTKSLSEGESQLADVLNLMSLSKVAENMVGDMGAGDHNHGISGGERKRLSVAAELLSDPLVLIADEPTSGLDSFQALQVMQILRDVAVRKNIITICTIHQPRSRIWNLFDDILILTPLGKVAYQGPREAALPFFKSIGYDCPTSTNPAEFLIDLVSIDTTSPQASSESQRRILNITQQFEAIGREQVASFYKGKDIALVSSNSLSDPSHSQQGPFGFLGNILVRGWRSFKRFSLLFGRAAKQSLRDGKVNVVRAMTSAVLAMVVSSVYGYQGPNISPKSIPSRVNIIAQGSINVAMLSMIKTLQLFKKERSIIDRERAQSEYTAFEYLLAKSCAELPLDAFVAALFGFILHHKTKLSCSQGTVVKTLSLLSVACSSLGLAVGALAPTGDIALAVGPALMVVYVIMGAIGPAGVGADRLPTVLRPFRDCSPLKWACEALCSAEFRGKDLDLSDLGNSLVETPPARTARPLKFIAKPLVMVSNLPPIRLIGKLVSSLLIRPSGIKEGDNVLTNLGIGRASYEEGTNVLLNMLGYHLLLALIGLIISRSQE